MNNDNKVGLKEYISILILSQGLKLTDTTPTTFFKIGKNAGWMIPLVSLPIVLFALNSLLKLLKKYKDKNYIEIIYELTGKYVGFIISFAIFFTVTSLTIVNTRSYIDILSTLYFPRTPDIVLATILIGSSFIMAWLGFEAIGRTAWMVLPWVIFSLTLYIVLTANLLTVDYLFPIGGAGIGKTVKAGIGNSGIFLEIISFAVIFPQIKSFKDFKNASFFSLIYNTVALSLFSAIYIMVLDYPAVTINSYPFHVVARLIYGGRFISNIEAFFLIFWIISSVVRFGIYMYSNTLIFCYTLRLKNGKPLLATISALTLALCMTQENYVLTADTIKPYLLSFSIVSIFMVPIVLNLISKWKEGNSA